jgi:hypothetical protein
MNLKPNPSAILLVLSFSTAAVNANQNQLQHFETYRQHGVVQSDPQRGEKLWFSSENNRSCTSCHGNDPGSNGKHIKTGKLIHPMALSVNPVRYQTGKKIEKWFLRNCKWTFGRECNAQEKADILAWLASQ